jgi:hypothetical protein
VAESSPGWLIPDDLSASAVRKRALDLLGAFLSEEQRFEAERYGGYRVEHPGRTFWIPLEGSPRCAVLDEGTIRHLCIAPRRRNDMPAGDVVLTYHLWIATDPEGFLAEANVLRTETFEAAGSDALLRVFARERRTSTPRRRRPRRRRPRSPALQRDVDDLRALFERHGRSVPDELPALLDGL